MFMIKNVFIFINIQIQHKLIPEFIKHGIAVYSSSFHSQDLEEYFLSLMEGGTSHV